MVENWLITGGCGFIGSSLIQYLIKNYPDVNIRILDNFEVGTPEDLEQVASFSVVQKTDTKPSGVELLKGDITNYENCLNAAEGCDVIVHLAANTGVGPSVDDPRLDMTSNVIGTFNMLEAARHKQVSKFIFASSGAPVGELLEPPMHEELPAHPVSPYGASKLAGEGYCSAYYRTYGVNTIALRFGNVYGPRSKNKSSVVAKFIKQAMTGETCEIYGSGTQTRDFIYIDDLVEAISKSAQAEVGGEVFQIATNKEKTVNEVAELIKVVLRKRDIDMSIIHGDHRLGDVNRNFSDTSKAKNILGWGASTSLEYGIEVTIDSFI